MAQFPAGRRSTVQRGAAGTLCSGDGKSRRKQDGIKELAPRRAALLALSVAPALACLVGCDILANLSQFDGARGAGVDAGSDVSFPGDETRGGDHDAMAQSREADAPAEAGDGGPLNLIQNPGFENGIPPWTTFSDGNLQPVLTTSSTYAHSGSFSGWVSKRTQSFEGPVQNIHQSVVQGQTYKVSAWAMVAYPETEGGTDASFVDGGTDASSVPSESLLLTAAITCLSDGSDVSNYPAIGAAVSNAMNWVQISGNLTVPMCDNMIALDIYVEGPESGVDLYVDDVSVTVL